MSLETEQLRIDIQKLREYVAKFEARIRALELASIQMGKHATTRG